MKMQEFLNACLKDQLISFRYKESKLQKGQGRLVKGLVKDFEITTFGTGENTYTEISVVISKEKSTVTVRIGYIINETLEVYPEGDRMFFKLEHDL